MYRIILLAGRKDHSMLHQREVSGSNRAKETDDADGFDIGAH
jgi:hypothetical protein